MGLFDFWARPREAPEPRGGELRKAVYCDPRYPASWVEDPERVARNLLDQAGFLVLNADELGAWLSAEISRGADGAVCVLAQGVAPVCIFPYFGRSLARRFMEAGGRLVWIGDVPFWIRGGPPDYAAPNDVVGEGGLKKILGIKNTGWDVKPAPVITQAGRAWGLTQPDDGSRCVPKDEVTEVLSESGRWAGSWFKNYNPSFPRSGFLRIRGGAFGGPAWTEKFSDLLRAALHGYPIESESAEGEVLACDPKLYAVKRAVYYDSLYPSSWVENPAAVAELLREKGGFRPLGAEEFGAWLESQTAGGAEGSVCVMSQGVAPETAAEVSSPRCLARRYLEAGGRMVWLGDIPFYYQGRFDGAKETWNEGQENVLGLEMGWDVGGEPVVTEQGKAWGLSRPGRPQRCAPKAKVTEALSLTGDWAASWFKNYNPSIPKSGFLRYLGSGLEDPAWASEVLALAIRDLPAPAPAAKAAPAPAAASAPAQGELLNAGAFGVDREAALRKIMRFQLPDASDYLLPWVRAAAAGGAMSIDFEVHEDRLVMKFDGEAFPPGYLAEPYQGLLGGDAYGPRARHAAVGMLSVMRFSPKAVTLASGIGASRLLLRVDSSQNPAVGPDHDSDLRNVFTVHWGEGPPDPRDHLERLRAAVAGCRTPIWVQGKRLAPAPETEQFLDFDLGQGVYGRLWIPAAPAPVSTLDAHVLGVRVGTVQARFALAQVRGWINDDFFSLNASQSGVTRNLRFHRTMRRVAAQAERLLLQTAQTHRERLPISAGLMIVPAKLEKEAPEITNLFDYWKERLERGPAAEEISHIFEAFRAVGKAARLLGAAGPCLEEDIRRVRWDARVTLWLREAAGRRLKDSDADAADPALKALWDAPLFLTPTGGTVDYRSLELQRRSLGFVPIFIWRTPAGKRPPFLMVWCHVSKDEEHIRRRFGDKVRALTGSFVGPDKPAAGAAAGAKLGVEAAGFKDILARAAFRFQGEAGEAALIEGDPARRARLYVFDRAGKAVGFKEVEGLLSYEAVYRLPRGAAVDEALLAGAFAAAEEAALPLYRELGRRFSDRLVPKRYYMRKHLIDHLHFAVKRGAGGGLNPMDAWLEPLWLLEFGNHGRSCANLRRDFRRRWCFHFVEPPKYWAYIRGREFLRGDSSSRAFLEALLPGAVFLPVQNTGTRVVYPKPEGLPPWESLKDAPGRELEIIEAIIHQAGTLPEQPGHPARVALVEAMTRRFHGFPGDVSRPWRRRLLDILQQLPLFRLKGGGAATIFELGGGNPDAAVSAAPLDLNDKESALLATLWPEPEKGGKTRKRPRARPEIREIEGTTGELLAGAWGYLARLRGRPGLLSVSDLLAMVRETKTGTVLIESDLERDLRAAYLASVAATRLNRAEKRLTDQADIDFQRDLARQLRAR